MEGFLVVSLGSISSWPSQGVSVVS